MVVKNLLTVGLHNIEIPEGVTKDEIDEWCADMEIVHYIWSPSNVSFKRGEDASAFILRFH